MVISRMLIGILLLLGGSYVRGMDDAGADRAIKSIITSYHKKDWISIKDEIRNAWQGWSKITEPNAKIEQAVQIIDLGAVWLEISPDFNPKFRQFVYYFIPYFIQDPSLTNAEKLDIVEVLAGYGRYGIHGTGYMAGILGDKKRKLISELIKAQYMPHLVPYPGVTYVGVNNTEEFEKLHTAYSLYRNSVAIPQSIKEQFEQHSFVDSIRIRFSHIRRRFGMAVGAVVAIGLCYAIYKKYYAADDQKDDEEEADQNKQDEIA